MHKQWPRIDFPTYVLHILPNMKPMSFHVFWSLQMSDLNSYSEKSIMSVLHWSLSMCTAVYILVAVCAYALFGSDTQEDILRNFHPGGLDHLVGERGEMPGPFSICTRKVVVSHGIFCLLP